VIAIEEFIMNRCLTRLGLVAALFALPLAADAAADPATEATAALGEVNALALHCGAYDQVRRIKSAVIASAPKTRVAGLVFEQATERAWGELTAANAPCPVPSDVAARVDVAVAALARAAGPGDRSAAPAEPAEDDLVGITPRYLLINQQGEAVTAGDFLGRYQIIYFGYTRCPDVCPTGLAALVGALKQLGPAADRFQPIFISVDPQRDTPAVLREYLGFFHPGLVGLTGPEQMVQRAAEAFRVRYEKVPDPDGDPDNYAMDHTATLFIVGPDGRYITGLAHGLSPAQIAATLATLP